MTIVKVGANVDSWCTKCKMVLAHTIEAVVGSTIKRVSCNTCRSKHVYRASEPGTKAASQSRSSGAKKLSAGAVKAGDLSRMLQGRDTASALPYSVKSKYARGDLVSHKLFGVGVVTVDKGDGKIEVLFEVGAKTLVHART